MPACAACLSLGMVINEQWCCHWMVLAVSKYSVLPIQVSIDEFIIGYSKHQKLFQNSSQFQRSGAVDYSDLTIGPRCQIPDTAMRGAAIRN